MAGTLQLRRAVSATRLGVLLADGELFVDTDVEGLFVGDGVQVGGHLVAAPKVQISSATTFNVLSTDVGKLLVFTGAGCAVALAQANSSSGAYFPSQTSISILNLGSGTVVITPATSTINGVSSISISVGGFAEISSNGSNYFAYQSVGGSAGTVTNVGTGTGLTGGPITTTGTIAVDTSVIATRAYAQSLLQDFNIKEPVLAATTGVLPFTPTYANGTAGVGATLTAGSNGVLTLDGVTPALFDRVLVKNQASALENGIYQITTLGTGGVHYVLTRPIDFDSPTTIFYGDTVNVLQGTLYANQQFTMATASVITVGTTAITWSQTSGGSQLVSGTGILITGNTVALDSIASLRLLANITGGAAPPLPNTLTAIIDALIGGANGDFLYRTGGVWTNQRPKYVIASSMDGVLAASQNLLHHRFTRAVTFPANFGAYLGNNSEAGGTANATASTVINVDLAPTATPNTFSNIGTITIAAGTVTPTFATAGGAVQNAAQGDVLRLAGPGSADATFAGFYSSLVGFDT